MSVWALAAASCLYLITCADYYLREDYGMALAFLAYAVANAGFVMAAR